MGAIGTKSAGSGPIGTKSSGSSYTDEQAQDAVGAMLDSTLEYDDATPVLRRAALTGDVTAPAGSNATTIANDAVTNAKLANMAEGTIKGRAAGAGTGDTTDLTATQVTAIVNNMVGDSGAGGTKGLVPAPAAGDAAAAKFLKADGTWTPAREKLSAARTYYVRTDGSDSNTGLVDSAGGAFLTIQKAVDVAAAFDNGGYDITIDVGNGTYTGAVSFAAFAGAGKIIIVGDETTPSNVIISTTSNSCFTHGLTAGTTGTWAVRGLRVQTTTSGSGFRLLNDAIVEIQNVDFGACADNHIQANKHTKFTVTGNYSISGGAIRHVNAGLGAFVSYVNALTLTISASCGFTTFVLCTSGSNVDFRGITITLGGGVAVTGTRYSATLNGVIQSNGGGATYFPGDVAGSTATGGQYA